MVGIAGPATAQVTADGLFGNAACARGFQQKAEVVVGLTGRTNTNLPFRMIYRDWTNLRSAMGIQDNPVSSITFTAEVIDLKANNIIQTINLGTATSTQDLSNATTNVTIKPITNYAVVVYTDFAGHGKNNPVSSVCFMSGGTYNVTNSLIASAFGGSRSGCFQLNDAADIRNCLCGRKDRDASGSLVQDSPNPGGFEFIGNDRIILGCAENS
ncbi:MAG: hypothetical protein OXD38_05455 [Aestuariivita sp.]|nr:hypothetical protein [Aestuariivita sp.]